jgi:error-prone DNA polymerase
MVHPYLRRRNGEEKIEYPSEELKKILGRTLGVPLFQEQAMEIAIVAAGFTPAEADGLRRSMATFKAQGKVTAYREKMVSGMTAKGYTEEFALRVFRQLEGFGSYGFPESHAVSFALLAYVSSWMKYYYPDVFAASLLNSMPMGFYQPAQIIGDARKHGVAIREVDINHSSWDNTLEEKVNNYHALRLGFREVKGLHEEEMQILMAARGDGFKTIAQLADAGISLPALEHLANADAFRSIGLDRRKALWEVTALKDHNIALFHGQEQDTSAEKNIHLPEMSLSQHVIEDYRTLSFSIKEHPLSFIRGRLKKLGITPNEKLPELKDGMDVKVAGLVLVRQRPGTASGIVFITLEDESGIANLVVFKDLFNKYRKEIVQCRLLMVEGKLQIEGEVIHIVVKKCYNLTGLLAPLSQAPEKVSADMTTNLDKPDSRDPKKNVRPASGKSSAAQVLQTDIFHGGRNFH